MRIHALPTEVVDRARALAGTDEHHELHAGAPGEPLRCCLTRSEGGQPLVLFGYSPEAGAGPYEEVGPVFVHAEACDGPERTDVLPAAMVAAPRVLRAYDSKGRIRGGELAPAADVEAMTGRLLADPAVEQVQVRSLSHGCFLFAVTRD
ncbi:DUF1203 domain-containing protein [Umezawaea sp. Da 62-37]|uniref:DUF1203 domain-containing protein n=1 Tax=Umezawaea sp. Da 62-37 TaxID=3075927 RepID=UPI0028F6E90E|nr:DUF1203 domain-containing protein [Umezawaea sp. Da 62-37]WNV91767.1 DUF1203 domain-containing protein [Umezawaea sp. Da 62-37]